MYALVAIKNIFKHNWNDLEQQIEFWGTTDVNGMSRDKRRDNHYRLYYPTIMFAIKTRLIVIRKLSRFIFLTLAY